MACPGSYRIAQAITTPAAPSRYATEGVLAHGMAEQLLHSGGPPDRFLGQELTRDGYTITIDQDMVEAVEIYLRAVDPIIQKANWWVTENGIELKAYWRPDKPPVPLYGTADLIAYRRNKRRLTVVDYKHGAGVYVSHIDNPQPYYYAAGALVLCEQQDDDVSEVEMVIVQPRVPGHTAVRSIVVPTIDVLAWVETQLKPAVEATQQPNAPLNLGDHCRFCPGRVICPAMQELRIEAAKRAFEPVAQDVKDATDADIGVFLDDIQRLEIWIEATRDEARNRIEAGGRIPGWGLVPTRPRRIWTEESVVTEWLHNAGYDDDRIYERSVRSPTQMQKQVRHEDWRDLQNLIDVKSAGTKLARQPRPDAATQFDVTQETKEP